MGRDKKPVAGISPNADKRPSAEPEESGKNSPVWRFSIMDFDGPFGCGDLTAQTAKGIHSKLSQFEGMNWNEIERSGSHNVSRDKLTKEAQERLKVLKQDDIDELFSLRLAGKERIWGIRERSVLRLLWWDPEHRVCPSHKKHT